MLLSFAYLAFSAVLRLLVGGRRSEFAEDIEPLCYDVSSCCSAGDRRALRSGRPIVLSSRHSPDRSRVGGAS